MYKSFNMTIGEKKPAEEKDSGLVGEVSSRWSELDL